MQIIEDHTDPSETSHNEKRLFIQHKLKNSGMKIKIPQSSW